MSATELPHRKSLLKVKSRAQKPQEWWTNTTASASHYEVACGEESVAVHYSPGCNGLLLPCEELVLEDLEDLLLVGRLLLPVKVITGGRTAAGGTCTTTTRRTLTLCRPRSFTACSTNGTKVAHFSKLGKKALYFLLLAGVKSLNLSHVPNDEEEITT